MDENLKIEEVERPWGEFRRFTKNTNSTVKILTINPNEVLSLQSHQHRAEFWHVISGSGFFEIDGEKEFVQKGSEKYSPIMAKHRIYGGAEGLEVLEIGFGDFDENDIIRYEDKYERV
jgi:mannose-6-phosphate isomerase-like protein (cupin superfamily)